MEVFRIAVCAISQLKKIKVRNFISESWKNKEIMAKVSKKCIFDTDGCQN